MPIYSIRVSNHGGMNMRIDGTSNVVNYSQQVQPVNNQDQNTVQHSSVEHDVVQQTGATQKPQEDSVKDSAAATDIVQQIYATQKGQQTISEKAFNEAINRANKAIIGSRREFKYSVHEKTKEVMVKVVDPDTGDVIREIPPEKILDLVAKLQELAGVFVDEKR